MDGNRSFGRLWAALGAAVVLGNGAMDAAAERPVGGNGALPPIDRQPPAKVETATFALG